MQPAPGNLRQVIYGQDLKDLFRDKGFRWHTPGTLGAYVLTCWEAGVARPMAGLGAKGS